MKRPTKPEDEEIRWSVYVLKAKAKFLGFVYALIQPKALAAARKQYGSGPGDFKITTLASAPPYEGTRFEVLLNGALARSPTDDTASALRAFGRSSLRTSRPFRTRRYKSEIGH